MMRGRRVPVAAAIAALVLIVVWWVLPAKRTPVTVARAISELPLPKNASVIRFDEEWNSFNGDGHVHITLVLSEPQYIDLRASVAGDDSFQSTALAASRPERQLLMQCAPDVEDGIYRFVHERPGGSWRIVVLDHGRRQVLMCAVVT